MIAMTLTADWEGTTEYHTAVTFPKESILEV